MPAQTRKRFNAFEDLPAENAGEKIRLKPMSEGAEGQPQVERIERLKPSQMRPDRFQPRRLLPPVLRSDFYSGRLDCYAAAERWLTMAKTDDGVHEELERLMAMGDSFQEHGQIKPITGSWINTPEGAYFFQIETGERRFWAACLQRVKKHHKEEPLLRVEVVASPTRQRQVLENRHAEPPSAVGQACEVAALILAEQGIPPDPMLADEYDYYRKASEQRMPAGLWERITPIMQLTRPRMVQLLNILQLPSDSLDLADRYRLPERVLREVLSAPREQWQEMLQLSIRSQLTSDEVAELTRQPSQANRQPAPHPLPVPAEPGRDAIKALRRFARTMAVMKEASRSKTLDALADDLVVQGHAEHMVIMLNELVRLLQARLKRK
jgi:hypothetical protein